MTRKKVEVRECLQEPPESLDWLIGWVADIAARVPEGDRKGATVEFSAYDYYGSVEREWLLRYWRDETDDEMNKRLAANERKRVAAKEAAERAKRINEIREREAYERLKAKFEAEAK